MDRKIVEYKILSGTDTLVLELEINDYIQQWRHLFYSVFPAPLWYGQAMVKYEYLDNKD